MCAWAADVASSTCACRSAAVCARPGPERRPPIIFVRRFVGLWRRVRSKNTTQHTRDHFEEKLEANNESNRNQARHAGSGRVTPLLGSH